MLLCAVLMLAAFAWSGHLPVAAHGASQSPSRLPVVLRLPPPKPQAAVAVTGRVLDAMGFLLAGAEVAAGPARARTDAGGRFEIAVGDGLVDDLQIAAAGHRSKFVRSFPAVGETVVATLEPSAPWDELFVPSLSALGKLRGEGLVRGLDHAPLAAALVLVAETGALARTDAAGRYEIALQDGPNTLIVQYAGKDDLYLAARTEPVSPSRATGRVPLPEIGAARGGAVRGTIRDAHGAPQPGAPVQVVGDGYARTVLAGEGGVFRFGGLMPGSYDVAVLAHHGLLGAHASVQLGLTTVDCELHLRPARGRRVRIVDKAGAPVRSPLVATSIDGLRRDVARGDGDGYVELRATDEAARFEVRAGSELQPLRVLESRVDADQFVVVVP